jgi:hypothetical protein
LILIFCVAAINYKIRKGSVYVSDYPSGRPLHRHRQNRAGFGNLPAGLNVMQSAVTASLEVLEAEVGRKLFDRHSNGVTRSCDGQQFLQRARAIISLKQAGV